MEYVIHRSRYKVLQSLGVKLPELFYLVAKNNIVKVNATYNVHYVMKTCDFI